MRLFCRVFGKRTSIRVHRLCNSKKGAPSIKNSIISVVWACEVLKSNADESFKKLKWLGCFTQSDLPSFLPFPIFQRERSVVEFPLKDVVREGLLVAFREERVWRGGVAGGQTGVEVDTLHVEIAPCAVHQSSTRVADPQHRPWQIQRGEISSPSYQLVCIVPGYIMAMAPQTSQQCNEKFHPFFCSFLHWHFTFVKDAKVRARRDYLKTELNWPSTCR